MRVYLRLAFLVFFIAVGIYFISKQLTGIRASEEGLINQTNNAETTLKVLTEHCGKCHQSSLSTAVPKALEIFDLDKKPWHISVSDKHLESISKRINTKSGVFESDRTAVLEFITEVRKRNNKTND
jgi:hypothetical protein